MRKVSGRGERIVASDESAQEQHPTGARAPINRGAQADSISATFTRSKDAGAQVSNASSSAA
jgi:hypothetical protein